MKRKETMLIECCKLKMGPSLPESLLQMAVLGKKSIRFYKRLAEINADKWKEPILIVTNNIRTLICFSLLRSDD